MFIILKIESFLSPDPQQGLSSKRTDFLRQELRKIETKLILFIKRFRSTAILNVLISNGQDLTVLASICTILEFSQKKLTVDWF